MASSPIITNAQALVEEQSVEVLSAQLEAERRRRASLALRNWAAVAILFGVAVGGTMITHTTVHRVEQKLQKKLRGSK